MLDRVADGNSASPTLLRVLIPVQQQLQPVGKSRSNFRVAWLNVNIGDVTRAICVGRHRHDQCRGQEVANLNSHMIVAMSKRGQLHDSWILGLSRAEHLREDRMRYWHVQSLGARIGNAKADVIHGGQVVVKGSEKGLTCGGIHGCVSVGLTNGFDENLRDELYVISHAEVQDCRKETRGLPSLVSSASGDVSADVCTLDFRQYC